MAAKGKILLVDDEPEVLLFLRDVLRDMGHDLVLAHSGREALSLLQTDDYSVILLDVRMPSMDGFETATLIRGRERNRRTPIIFLTAAGSSDNEVLRGYQVGAVDYLVKPFVPGILRYKVAVLMDLQAKTRDLLAANEALLALNASLERRVRDRTAELEAQGRQLARSNEELSQFANIASHDLQEPLRSVSTYLHLLQRSLGPEMGPEDRGHVDSAVAAASRMRQMISGLLDFFRLDAEAAEPGEVDCGRLVAEVLEDLAGAIQEKGAGVVVGPLPAVPGEAALLSQLFQNLVDNAVKFSQGPAPRVEIGGRGGPWRPSSGSGTTA